MKVLAILLAAAALAAATSRVALAHPDVLGAPDPYWQNVAATTSGAGGERAGEGASAGRGAALPRLLDGFVYVSGGLSVLLVVSLLRSLRASAKRSER